MKQLCTKILLIAVSTIFFSACNTVKRVGEDELLLKENQIFVDSSKTKNPKLYNQLYQQPNARVLGIPIRLHIYNLASKDKDSSFYAWLNKKPKRKKRMVNFFSKKQVNRLATGLDGINEWIKKTGEAPAIQQESRIKKSVNRLNAYYWNNGWFNVSANYSIDTLKHKKSITNYYVTPRLPYFIDSLKTKIQSTPLDSLYAIHQKNSLIVKGKQYKTLDIEAERDRLTGLFRNSGIYHFEKEYIKFDADTVNTDHKVNMNLIINDRQIEQNGQTTSAPFKVHNISKVKIFTDYSFQNRDKVAKDTLLYRGYEIYAFDEMRYTRKAITNSVLISPGQIFRDIDRTRTYNQISNLRAFKYPNIEYEIDTTDASGKSLIANILLTPRKKYSTNFEFDVSTSTIQDIGIGFGGSFLIRNVFRGAEILEISGRGSIGSSQDAAESEERFFNISEIGADLRLTFPKIVFPFNTNRIIPKYMTPTTNLIFGINSQQNIGLDKQNASGIFNYIWKPNKFKTNQFDLLNVQYVRNLNTGNYFRIYRNSFNQLNSIANEVLDPSSPLLDQESGDLSIPGGANGFIEQSLGSNPNSELTPLQLRDIRNINERKNRLTEDNLIFATSYTYIKNNRENLYDENFSRFRGKIELAGNVLSTISNTIGLKKNSNDRFEVFGVEFSQYAKLELDYIKHWEIGSKNIIAFRSFGGIAIPYGNANSIPFARSFFAGGPNDNRAWLAYDLGPGSTQGRNEFNEANLKLAFNTEYRFDILGALKGALFIDAGNIWNVLDNVEEEEAVFSGVKDLQEIAVGTGFGVRYDFDFFVIRLDVAFKTFNPANDEDQRWFKGYNFSEAVYNFGINYPF
ncbi:BamA/TamA family outer membrane protein [Aquimarina brevivitae]|uniref:Outer membrane protein assembly factor BamA n=1 Tax=Aquimarina brevivitae TaxID=323412 RepID=A0A4Q7NYE6_9FLAO|nr:BamA/TamA family outer membrane protein [Aquimarina brevivitae]RZS91988.1 outer membrane protein assembly factor BamA [Aquimarina brevivitae]